MERSSELSIDEVFIKSLMAIVQSNLTNDQFGAEELANAVGISRSQIHRKLQRIVGKSITQFIREMRLEEALRLLQKEVGTAAEISYQVGFSGPTYFNTCFHEYFGFPPGEVKKNKGRLVAKPHDLINKLNKINIIPIHQEVEGFSSDERLFSETGIISSDLKSKARGNKKIFWGAFMFLILVAITVYILSPFLFQMNLPNPFSNSKIIEERSIAVLPFDHISSEQEEHFTNGVMEDIRYNLSMMGDLRVTTKTSTEKYRDTKLSAKEIARELGVGYLLEGTVQKQQNQLKIHVRLIDGKTEEGIWTEIYRRNIQDYFETQSEIALQIAEALYVTISPEEKERIYTIHAKNLSAIDFYSRARDEHTEFWVHGDLERLHKALKFYHTALEYDSTFARAYAGIGLTYFDQIKQINYDDINHPNWDSVLIFSEKALLYNDQLGEAHLLHGVYDYYKNASIDKALEQIDLALHYDPNNFRAYELKGYILPTVIGNYKDAIINIIEAINRNRGIELANLYWNLARSYNDMGFYSLAKNYYEEEYKMRENTSIYHSRMGFLEFTFGNYDQSIDWYEKSIENDTSNFISPVFLIAARQYEKSYQSSLKYLKNSEGKPWIADALRIGFSFWQMGHYEEGRYYFNMQIERCMESMKNNTHYAQRKFLYYDLAATYSFLGEKEKAIKYLEGLKNKHSYPLYVVNMLKNDDPMFDNLRNEPRFQEVVSHVEGRYQRERENLKVWLIENGLFRK